VHATLFGLKMPYLIADVATGLLILALVGGAGVVATRKAGAGPDPRLVRRAWAFWMLSPIGLYASYVFGRYEALAVVFVVGALLCMERERPWWAALLLGLGVTMRGYPLLLVPIFALIVFRRPLAQAAWAGVAVLPFLAVMASNRLLAGTVGELARLQDFATGSTFFAYTIPIDGDGQLYVFFVFAIGLYGVLAGRVWGWWGAPPLRGDAWIWLLVFHAGMFGLATFAAHYFMWFTPFVAIAIARRASWRGVLPLHLAQAALVLALTDLLGGPGTLTGLFEPVHPDLATSPAEPAGGVPRGRGAPRAATGPRPQRVRRVHRAARLPRPRRAPRPRPRGPGGGAGHGHRGTRRGRALGTLPSTHPRTARTGARRPPPRRSRWPDPARSPAGLAGLPCRGRGRTGHRRRGRRRAGAGRTGTGRCGGLRVLHRRAGRSRADRWAEPRPT
jgi:hypothetical protein